MSDPPGQLAPSPILVAASLVIVGVLSGWFVHARVTELAAVADRPSNGSAAHPRRPDIFLVTLGNVGASHLPTWRYARATTPWLTEVVRRSHTFSNASATSSWSLPSTVSLLTGLLPSQHGLEQIVTPNGVTATVPGLPDTVRTLAERLEATGYATHAVVSNPLFLAETGLARGFDTWTNLGFVRAGRVRFGVERIGVAIEKSAQPAFVWIHYGDAHLPYASSSPIANVWANSGDEYGRMGLPELLARPELAVPGPALDALRTLYDGELRTLDDHLQLLYGDLAIEDDDVVVITSDHGEAFREHGQLGHGHDLYEETVRVPLVVSWPSEWPDARRHPERVSLVDLVPTLAALGGAPVGDGELPAAESLLPLLDGEPWTRELPVISELLRADGARCRAMYLDDRKLHAGSAGEVELYDLEVDPEEQRDLAAAAPAQVHDLVERLDAVAARLPSVAPVQVSASLPPNLAEQLVALGYALPEACP